MGQGSLFSGQLQPQEHETSAGSDRSYHYEDDNSGDDFQIQQLKKQSLATEANCELQAQMALHHLDPQQSENQSQIVSHGSPASSTAQTCSVNQPVL